MLAARLDERRTGAAGRTADRAIGWLPVAVGGKLVALLVEAGSLAGYRRADAGGAI
jgi:hypothetical protein